MDKKVFENLSYGMYIIGAKEEKNVGCIANTVVQITSQPMTIAVSLHHDNLTNQTIQKTKEFSVSILPEKTDPKVIATFGYQSSREIDKYENLDTVDLEGFPVLKNSCGAMICKVIDTMETSTHTIFLAEVIQTDYYQETPPMTYRYYREVLKLKSPKNAPTYVEDSKGKKKTVWKCSVCGYEVEMESLPEDYRCPVCGKPASFFEKIEKEIE